MHTYTHKYNIQGQLEKSFNRNKKHNHNKWKKVPKNMFYFTLVERKLNQAFLHTFENNEKESWIQNECWQRKWNESTACWKGKHETDSNVFKWYEKFSVRKFIGDGWAIFVIFLINKYWKRWSQFIHLRISNSYRNRLRWNDRWNGIHYQDQPHHIASLVE